MQLTNAQLSKTETFQKQCEYCNIKSTRRQASKWRRKCGSLYKALQKANTERSFEIAVVAATVKILEVKS